MHALVSVLTRLLPRLLAVVAAARARPTPDWAAFPIDGHLVDAPVDHDDGPATRTATGTESSDGGLVSGTWESHAGRLDLCLPFDEWVHILEGEAIVTANGRTRTLRAGDAAFFAADLPMTWEIPSYVRKVWVHRHTRRPLPVRVAKRALASVRG